MKGEKEDVWGGAEDALTLSPQPSSELAFFLHPSLMLSYLQGRERERERERGEREKEKEKEREGGRERERRKERGRGLTLI